MIQSAVPLILMFTLLLLIARELRKASRIRNRLCSATALHRSSTSTLTSRSTLLTFLPPDSHMSRGSWGRRRPVSKNSDNLMLLCVIGKLLISRSVPLALDTSELVWAEAAETEVFAHISIASNALVALNAATNALLYASVYSYPILSFSILFLLTYWPCSSWGRGFEGKPYGWSASRPAPHVTPRPPLPTAK